MSIVSIMAAILEDELREHGILKLTQLDCETMVHSMIDVPLSLRQTSNSINWNRILATEPEGLW